MSPSSFSLIRFFRPCLIILLLFAGGSVMASPEKILRLNPGGHTAMIRQLVVTPNGYLVTASDDKTVRICDPDALCENANCWVKSAPGGEKYTHSPSLRMGKQ